MLLLILFYFFVILSFPIFTTFTVHSSWIHLRWIGSLPGRCWGHGGSERKSRLSDTSTCIAQCSCHHGVGPNTCSPRSRIKNGVHYIAVTRMNIYGCIGVRDMNLMRSLPGLPMRCTISKVSTGSTCQSWLISNALYTERQKKHNYYFFRATLTKIHPIKINHIRTQISFNTYSLIRTSGITKVWLCQKGEKCGEIAKGIFWKIT